MDDKQFVEARVTRSFKARPEQVFDAWLDTAMIGQWMFGPRVREEEIVSLTADARVGGVFSFVVRREGDEVDHTGRYVEIDRPRRLVFTWGIAGESEDGSLVRIEMVPLETGCELSLAHVMHPDWAAFVSRSEAAWSQMLNALAAALGPAQDKK